MSTHGQHPGQSPGSWGQPPEPGGSYYDSPGAAQEPAYAGPDRGGVAHAPGPAFPQASLHPGPAYAMAPQPPRSKALGVTALAVLAVAMVVGTVWSIPLVNALMRFSDAHPESSDMPPDILGYALGIAALWLVGVLCFVLGIVAAITGRGRIAGVLAIALSLIAPFLTLGVGMAVGSALGY